MDKKADTITCNGDSYTLRIPTQSMSGFRLLEVKGDVGAVSTYKKPLTEIGRIDSDVKINRQYYKANETAKSGNTFDQGYLVRVQITVNYSAKAINGSYCVTDYLPSGLEYVSNSARTGNWNRFGY